MKLVSVCDGANVSGLVSKELGIDHVLCIDKSPHTEKLLSKNTQLIGELGEWSGNGFFAGLEFDILFFKQPKMKAHIFGENKHDDFYSQEFCKILDLKKPQWFIWEMHPRVILGNHGKQFKRIIGEVAALGYGVSWRVLDSQFFGSPIKAPKMYVVGYFGAWEETREVLFESGSYLGDSEIKGQKRKKFKLQNLSKGEGIRQLTFTEMEKAMGLKTGHTKKIDDENRMKVLKNSTNANIVRFLLERIQRTSQLNNT